MKLTDLPVELLAACLERASGGDPAALLANCAAHPMLMRQFRPMLGRLEHCRLDASVLQRLGQFARAPGGVLDAKTRNSHKLTHLLRVLTGQNSGIKSLELSGLHLTTKQLVAISDLSTLTSLRLRDCRGVLEAGLLHLRSLQQLQVLDLSGSCPQGRMQALEDMQSLEVLRVRGCWNLEDESFMPIAGNLRVLDACNCSCLSDDVCSLLNACEELDMAGTALTGQGLQLLAQHATKLRQLTIGPLWRTHFDQADVDAFKARRPEVQFIMLE